MIVVATTDFEVYHEVVAELRDRDVEFTTVEPGDPLPERTDVVITAGEDVSADPPVVVADPQNPRRTVEEALVYARGGDGRTVVGVDPGTRPGIAVLRGGMLVGAFQVPIEQAASVVTEEVAGDDDAVVRIGDGARLEGARIIDELDEARVELVDETGTTPFLGPGARGMGDVLAAANIALMAGEEIEGRRIEPTEGELEVIKARSREASEENRTIPEALARKVATGELTLDEALAVHRESTE
ncbi:hypothetical protein [Halobacterium bonnevillei]|uniref:Uncharacterized protein n=1 Tax=Halobacterium bonnevillei TaxID=2692200 RepID=A0A6B0SJ03_9EURY|nr:hypothetical protein [Halobacterium bonnevillei]MXR20486.1 hypothetical protein [Halobacterium bonnevillei]